LSAGDASAALSTLRHLLACSALRSLAMKASRFRSSCSSDSSARVRRGNYVGRDAGTHLQPSHESDAAFTVHGCPGAAAGRRGREWADSRRLILAPVGRCGCKLRCRHGVAAGRWGVPLCCQLQRGNDLQRALQTPVPHTRRMNFLLACCAASSLLSRACWRRGMEGVTFPS
jgi:hypothetical protein